jgi:hypothetical protein
MTTKRGRVEFFSAGMQCVKNDWRTFACCFHVHNQNSTKQQLITMADQLAGNVPPKWYQPEFKRLRLSFRSDFESEAIDDDISKIPEMVVAIEKTNYLSGKFVGPLGTILSFQEDHPRGIAPAKLEQAAIHLDHAFDHEFEFPGWAAHNKISRAVKLCAGLFTEAAEEVRSLYKLALFNSEDNEVSFHEAMRTTSTVAFTMNARYHSVYQNTGILHAS